MYRTRGNTLRYMRIVLLVHFLAGLSVIVSVTGRFSELFPLMPKVLNHMVTLPHVQNPHKVLWCNISLGKKSLVLHREMDGSILFGLKTGPAAPLLLNATTTLLANESDHFCSLIKIRRFFQQQKSSRKTDFLIDDWRCSAYTRTLWAAKDSTKYT